MTNDANDLQSSYDRLSAEYADRIAGELVGKPMDRELLTRFVAQTKGKGPVCDMGCGPGHIADFLHQQGASVFGIDLSPGMVEQARQMNPHIEFREGNMLALEDEAEAWAGIVAFYSIIHIPKDKVTKALREMSRVLKPGGLLLLSFHVGDEVRHFDELRGFQVNMDFIFFQRAEMEGYLQAVGFAIIETIERGPYSEDVEAQTQRAYVLARKPAR